MKRLMLPLIYHDLENVAMTVIVKGRQHKMCISLLAYLQLISIIVVKHSKYISTIIIGGS